MQAIIAFPAFRLARLYWLRSLKLKRYLPSLFSGLMLLSLFLTTQSNQTVQAAPGLVLNVTSGSRAK